MRRAGGIKPVYKSRAASTLNQGLESLSQEIVVITINYYDLPLESGGFGASKMIITLNNTSRLFPSYPLPLSRRISPLLIFALPLSPSCSLRTVDYYHLLSSSACLYSSWIYSPPDAHFGAYSSDTYTQSSDYLRSRLSIEFHPASCSCPSQARSKRSHHSQNPYHIVNIIQ